MYIDFPLGFDSKSVSVTGLEEYWQYRFKVIAATGKGNSTSDFSSTFRTKSGRKCHVRETYLYMHTLHWSYDLFWIWCSVYNCSKTVKRMFDIF